VRQSIKAVLLSGLVFPGVGHLYLRRYLRGVLLAAGAAALSYFIISVAVDSAFDIAGKIQNGEVPMNAESISALVSKASEASENATDIATMALFALWVIGTMGNWHGRFVPRRPCTR
jgi:hypothetical protein